MRPLIVVWPYALVFWTVMVWAFVPEFKIVSRTSERSATAQDAGSKLGIVLGQWIGLAVAFVGAVKVRRECFKLGGAGIDAVEIRHDAKRFAPLAHLNFADGPLIL